MSQRVLNEIHRSIENAKVEPPFTEFGRGWLACCEFLWAQQIAAERANPPKPAPEPVADACYADCVSPGVPSGYDTVLGYLAKHHPDVLDNFDYDEPQETQRDGFWLRHQCIKRGLTAISVEAPPVLKRRGIGFVRAWPLWLLQERWG